jgi:hypothetical protein
LLGIVLKKRRANLSDAAKERVQGCGSDEKKSRSNLIQILNFFVYTSWNKLKIHGKHCIRYENYRDTPDVYAGYPAYIFTSAILCYCSEMRKKYQ